jgi:UDP-2,3-diacylglucosamine pyrophosphatase LpxH
VHEEFEQLAHRLAIRKIKDLQLVQVGDFGLGFGNKNQEELNLKTLNKTLKSGNNILYVIRGNHDDPSYFQQWQNIGNIRLVPDYSVLDLGGYTVLLIGGAISIDRTNRTQGKNYWKEEVFLFDEEKVTAAISEIQNIDICKGLCNAGYQFDFRFSQ